MQRITEFPGGGVQQAGGFGLYPAAAFHGLDQAVPFSQWCAFQSLVACTSFIVGARRGHRLGWHGERDDRVSTSGWAQRHGQALIALTRDVGLTDDIAAHHGAGSFDAVFHFAHVAGPEAGQHGLHGVGIERQLAVVFIVES